MKLLNEVKYLRSIFPDIKIRQLMDEYNRKYAMFVLPECIENLKLIFEHDCMIMDFYGCKTIYGYPQREFNYLVNEIESLLANRTLAVVAESNGECCGSMIASADDICGEFLISAAKSLCRINGIHDPKNVFVSMHYCNSALDSTEYFGSLKI